MDQATAFAVFDGKKCCHCLVEMNEETKSKLTNADWCVDYDVTPCVSCWALSNEDQEEWMTVFTAVYDAILAFEDAYRAQDPECRAIDGKTDG
jgi:hypothetical protein